MKQQKTKHFLDILDFIFFCAKYIQSTQYICAAISE